MCNRSIDVTMLLSFFFFFFFNDTATTEIYTLSLHDALPISRGLHLPPLRVFAGRLIPHGRSEEHTSELQSQFHLVCRLLLEKKKKIKQTTTRLKTQKKTNTKKKTKNTK